VHQSSILLFILTIGTLSITITKLSPALAHEGATGIVKERMDAMEEMGKQSKRITRMFKNKEPVDATSIVTTANLFIKHGNKMQSLFPDSDQSRMKTRALPILWEEWQDFAQKTDEFVLLSENLKLKAESNNTSHKDLATAFRDTALSCRECHKKYRKPKKK